MDLRGSPSSPFTRQSSSVMKGMKGCRSLMISSSTNAAVACVSAFAAPSGPVSKGFESSTYQSQKIDHTKR